MLGQNIVPPAPVRLTSVKAFIARHLVYIRLAVQDKKYLFTCVLGKIRRKIGLYNKIAELSEASKTLNQTKLSQTQLSRLFDACMFQIPFWKDIHWHMIDLSYVYRQTCPFMELQDRQNTRSTPQFLLTIKADLVGHSKLECGSEKIFLQTNKLTIKSDICFFWKMNPRTNFYLYFTVVKSKVCRRQLRFLVLPQNKIG